MFYIHQTACISPQQTFPEVDLEILHESVDGKLKAIEPSYESIPSSVLRRMGKSVRLGVGAALPLLKQLSSPPDGFIIGTSNGGMEECVKFLNQLVQYEEGVLTPGSFVQSTPNAIAGQLGLLTNNKGYNITHVHRGLAFENAVLDVMMLLQEHPTNNYLLGAVDDVSSYNYNIELLAGWYSPAISNKGLYQRNTSATLSGEGAAMFIVNTNKENAIAKLRAVNFFHTDDETIIRKQVQLFLDKNLPQGETIDLLLSGEDGDSRFSKYYSSVEGLLGDISIARFKHMSGSYLTVSAFALWLSCRIIQTNNIASHLFKKESPRKRQLKNILIYNTERGSQHSCMLLTQV